MSSLLNLFGCMSIEGAVLYGAILFLLLILLINKSTNSDGGRSDMARSMTCQDLRSSVKLIFCKTLQPFLHFSLLIDDLWQ